MKFIIEVSFPHEPFNTFVREGTIGKKIDDLLGAIKPEVCYFTDSGVGRGAIMIVNLADASVLPQVTEPLMLALNATVHYRIAIHPEELAKAGLDRYKTK